MKVSIFKHVAILLLLASNFSSCWQEESKSVVEDKSLCDPNTLLRKFPNSGGNPPWVYEVIAEWLENGIHGSITRCDFKDGRGYLFEPIGNSKDFGYSFLTCDSTVLYEGEGNPIDTTYPELNIKRKVFLLGIYPSWEQEHEGASDEYLCHVINPFTLPRVKEMLYRCSHYSCYKRVSICTYRDGVGFLLWNHLNAGYNADWEFLDCGGNLLCSKSQVNSLSFPPELNIDDQNEKLLLKSFISLTVN